MNSRRASAAPQAAGRPAVGVVGLGAGDGELAMTKDIHPTEAGAQDMTKEQTVDTLYETPHFQRSQVASQVDNAGALILEATETEEGDEMGAYWKTATTASQEMRDIPSPDEDELSENYFLETEERILGEQKEMERHREKALAAQEASVSRAERCREEVTADTMYQQTTPDDGVTAPGVNPDDPRAEMSQEKLAEVNKAAGKLAEHFAEEPTVGRAVLSKQIARRVDGGDSVLDAMMQVKESTERFEGVKQELADINPYEQREATVEVEVEMLWDPKSSSQRQVGLVTDDSGERVKFTIWRAAGDKPLIHEGDTIRVERAKVNAYHGDVTLAVAGDTEIQFLEEGDRGELPKRHGVQKDGHTPPAWSADSDTHAWIADVDMEEAVKVTLDDSDEE